MPPAAAPETLIGELRGIREALSKWPQWGGVESLLPVYQASVSDRDRETVLMRYTVGKLRFKDVQEKGVKIRYGLLDMQMYKLDGTPEGKHRTIWRPLDTNTADLLTMPFDFDPKTEHEWDNPTPIGLIRMTANSKAVWHFNDVDSIRATGPANLFLTPLKNGTKLFLVSVAAIITGGTGEFEGCVGVKTALGSSLIPAEVNALDEIPEGTSIGGVTIETFRVVRSPFVAQPPPDTRPLSKDWK